MKALGKFGLLLLAVCLAIPVFIGGGVYAFGLAIITMSVPNAWDFWGNLAFALAISIDMLGNVIAGPLFNRFLIAPTGYRFGKPGETISRVLAINQRDGTLKRWGQRLINVIEFFDRGHMQRELNALDKLLTHAKAL